MDQARYNISLYFAEMSKWYTITYVLAGMEAQLLAVFWLIFSGISKLSCLASTSCITRTPSGQRGNALLKASQDYGVRPGVLMGAFG
jgi:hypothetical protein